MPLKGCGLDRQTPGVPGRFAATSRFQKISGSLRLEPRAPQKTGEAAAARGGASSASSSSPSASARKYSTWSRRARLQLPRGKARELSVFTLRPDVRSTLGCACPLDYW